VNGDPPPDATTPASPPLPAALIARSERWLFGKQWTVYLTQDGMSWHWDGTERGGTAPWAVVGGLSARMSGKAHLTDILGMDGQTIGTVGGLFDVGNSATDLPHIVALFRPDLFVDIPYDPFRTMAGCIRREVVDAEAASTNPTIGEDTG
jgi:hypothetical protein